MFWFNKCYFTRYGGGEWQRPECRLEHSAIAHVQFSESYRQITKLAADQEHLCRLRQKRIASFLATLRNEVTRMNKFRPKTQRATLWHRKQRKSTKAFDDGNTRDENISPTKRCKKPTERIEIKMAQSFSYGRKSVGL